MNDTTVLILCSSVVILILLVLLVKFAGNIDRNRGTRATYLDNRYFHPSQWDDEVANNSSKKVR